MQCLQPLMCRDETNLYNFPVNEGEFPVWVQGRREEEEAEGINWILGKAGTWKCMSREWVRNRYKRFGNLNRMCLNDVVTGQVTTNQVQLQL